MKVSQLGANSNVGPPSETPNQQNNNKTEPPKRSNFLGHRAVGIRNSFKRFKRTLDISAPEASSTGASVSKRRRTDQYSVHSLDVREIAPEALIRAKVKGLASGKINVNDFMSWYEPEQRTAVSQVALYNNYDKIKKQIAKLMLSTETTSLLKDKVDPLVQVVQVVQVVQEQVVQEQVVQEQVVQEQQVVQERVDENKNQKMTDIKETQKANVATIRQIFQEIKKIHTYLPEKPARETDPPAQLNLGLWPSLDQQREEGSSQTPDSPYLRLLNNPEFALQLHEHPDAYKAITSELTQLMKECETNILSGGRVRPKGLSREECRCFFFACCAWESEDFQLISQLQRVKPQKQAITQLTTLICDHFMEESLNNNTAHSWLTTREDKYREEAKLARGRCVLEEHKTDCALLQNIIGRPQGLREDLRLLCKKISELMTSRKDIRKKLVKLKIKSEAFLGDRIRNKDLLATNNFTISCYYDLRAVLQDIPNPPWWSKNWPFLYADYMKAKSEEKVIAVANPEPKAPAPVQHKTNK